MSKDRLKEIFSGVDWRDYFEDYKINPRNSSGGVKLIPINRKSSNEYSFEELLNINDTPILDLSFNVRDRDQIIDCLINGNEAICSYKKGKYKSIIIYNFNHDTNILTRSYNGDKKKYHLTDEQVVAIVKFLIDKCNEKNDRDLNNNKNISNNENNNNIKNSENVKDIFSNYIKTIFDEKIEIAKTKLQFTHNLNDYNLKEEIYNIWIELKQDNFIINICKNNKVYCDKNQKDQLKELLQEYYKELVK